jgi:uncharacterized protein YjbI with pentapeptide repeats
MTPDQLFGLMSGIFLAIFGAVVGLVVRLLLQRREQRQQDYRKALNWSGSGRKESLRGIRLAECDLSKVDLAGADLRQADLQDAILEAAELNGADLEEAVLSKANLNMANLREANLARANLREASLIRANLGEVFARQVNLTGADLSEANIQDAYLIAANLSQAILRGADLTGAHLEHANLQRTDLTDARQRLRMGKANLTVNSLLGVWSLLEAFKGNWLALLLFPSVPLQVLVDAVDQSRVHLEGANLQDAILPDGSRYDDSKANRIGFPFDASWPLSKLAEAIERIRASAVNEED